MVWNSSDAWLLQTILQSTIRNPTVDLDGIISVGDYLNHAIFNWEEFFDGMERLMSVKYVKEKNGKFSLTPLFRKQYEAFGKAPKSMAKEYIFLKEFLEAKPISEKVKKVELKITEETYRAAVADYQKRF